MAEPPSPHPGAAQWAAADRSAMRAELLAAFGETGQPAQLPGGEGRTYRAGDRVYRREADPVEASFCAALFATLPQHGFRVPRPLPTRDGAWVSAAGWSGWSFVTGRPATTAELPAALAATMAFHAALAEQPRPAYLVARDTPFDRADRLAWDAPPPELHPELAPLVAPLAARCRPVDHARPQLIHGDLSPGNILIDAGQLPAIIDMTPYWRPPVFAAAVLAYWLGPYHGDATILPLFAALPDFGQMLLRAALRSLYVQHEFGQLGHRLAGVGAEYRAATAVVCAWADR